MANLPEKLSLIRPLILFLRKVIWKILGAYNTADVIRKIGPFPPPEPVDNGMLRIWDRLNILESHVNWRLHGLPPRLVNVKLEQAGLFAGSGEIEEVLEILKQNSLAIPKFPEFLAKKISGARSVFMFPGDNNQEWNAVQQLLKSDAKVTLIDDTSDLFRYKENEELVENERVKVLRSSAIECSARLVEPEFDLIWVSSILQRVTPLQAMIILKRSFSALVKEGVFAGMVSSMNKEANWPDPRWVHPFNQKQIESLFKYSGLNSVKFQSWDSFELFHFNKK